MVQDKRMIQREFSTLRWGNGYLEWKKSDWGFSQLLWALKHHFTTNRTICSTRRYAQEYEVWKAITKDE
jgi:hypothetical protein